MFSVQEVALGTSDEELTSVAVLATVGLEREREMDRVERERNGQCGEWLFKNLPWTAILERRV